MKTFLPNITPQRPVLLIQDSATAHVSPELIDAAIENQVILLCLPSKMTHLLQPCDVSIFKKMRSEISHLMTQIKMVRGENWVSKARFPTVFKEIFLNTMVPSIICDAFHKCGIMPLNKHAIEQEFITTNTDSPVEHKKPMPEQQDSVQEAISEPSIKTHPDPMSVEISVEVIDDPSNIPPEAELLFEQKTDDVTNESICPPELALHAIESTLAAQKKEAYQRRYEKRGDFSNDPVYQTWSFLYGGVQGKRQELKGQNPLVKAGVIPGALADVFTTPDRPQAKKVHLNAARARVLTNDDISAAIFEKDRKTKMIAAEKKQKQSDGEDKKKQKENMKTSNKKPLNVNRTKRKEEKNCHNPEKTTERQQYFAHIQGVLSAWNTLAAMKTVLATPFSYPSPTLNLADDGQHTTDQIAQCLLESTGTENMKAVPVYGDGNCLPRAASFLCCGNEDRHIEMRVRIAAELASYSDWYLTNNSLSNPGDSGGDLVQRYAMYSGYYDDRLSVAQIFENEVLNVVKPSRYCGIWGPSQ